jgi:hypothetical protein
MLTKLRSHTLKHLQALANGSPLESGAGAPEIFTVSSPNLAAAIRAELEEFFDDGVSPTLGQYAVDHIIGGILQRVSVDSFPANN